MTQIVLPQSLICVVYNSQLCNNFYSRLHPFTKIPSPTNQNPLQLPTNTIHPVYPNTMATTFLPLNPAVAFHAAASPHHSATDKLSDTGNAAVQRMYLLQTFECSFSKSVCKNKVLK